MKRASCYLSTDAIGLHPDTGQIAWRNTTGSPVPVFKVYGVTGGRMVLELPGGDVIAVETGKGQIIGTYWVEGPAR